MIARLADSLSIGWAKALFLEFMADSGGPAARSGISELAKRSVEAFRIIGAAFDSVESITAAGVHTAFLTDSTQRRFRAVKTWLSKRLGLDFSGGDIEKLRHEQKVQRLMQAAEQPWIQAAARALLAELYHWRNKRLMAGAGRGSTPMALASIELAVRYALSFLSYCHSHGARGLVGVTQAMADGYAEHRPKVYQSLGSFFRYLNRTSHRLNTLSLPPKRGRRNSTLNVLDPDTRARLVRTWLNTRDTTNVRNAAIALLVALYAQRLPTVLNLKLDQVKDEDGAMVIDLGHYAIEINPEVAVVIRIWTSERKEMSRFRSDNSNPFLFPGYTPGKGLSDGAFSSWLLSRHGVISKQLFATAVHGMIESGLDDPGILVAGLGLTASTAMKYWTDSGRDLSTFIFAESIQLLRDQGLHAR